MNLEYFKANMQRLRMNIQAFLLICFNHLNVFNYDFKMSLRLYYLQKRNILCVLWVILDTLPQNSTGHDSYLCID